MLPEPLFTARIAPAPPPAPLVADDPLPLAVTATVAMPPPEVRVTLPALLPAAPALATPPELLIVPVMLSNPCRRWP